MTTIAHDADYVPEEEELEALYDTVLSGFGPISGDSPHSPFPSSASGFSDSQRSSIATIEPRLDRPVSRASSESLILVGNLYSDVVLVAWSVSSQPFVAPFPLPPQQPRPAPPSTARSRRPLPQPPGPPNGASTQPVAPRAPEIPPSSSQPGPSTS